MYAPQVSSAPSSDPPVIVTYQPRQSWAFRDLNLEWLVENELLEPADLHYLDHPEENVLAEGGEIFFALRQERPIGTCAALVLDPETVELAKLAVIAEARGRGIGRALCEAVFAFARNRGAKRVVLTSNHRLEAAVRLYEALGFEHAPLPPDIRYETADVYMVRGVG